MGCCSGPFWLPRCCSGKRRNFPGDSRAAAQAAPCRDSAAAPLTSCASAALITVATGSAGCQRGEQERGGTPPPSGRRPSGQENQPERMRFWPEAAVLDGCPAPAAALTMRRPAETATGPGRARCLRLAGARGWQCRHALAGSAPVGPRLDRRAGSLSRRRCGPEVSAGTFWTGLRWFRSGVPGRPEPDRAQFGAGHGTRCRQETVTGRCELVASMGALCWMPEVTQDGPVLANGLRPRMCRRPAAISIG